jgi:Protein of unknown function (DUF3618)
MTSQPDQIRDSIEQTQRELSTDVNALTGKLSPKRVAQRRTQRARTAMSSMKDRVMGTAAQTSSAASGTASSAVSSARDTLSSATSAAASTAGSLPDAARRGAQGNPVAAGLIVFGASWLISSLLPASEPEQQAAAKAKDFAMEKGRPVAQELGQAGREAAGQLRESAQEKAESVKETAADAATAVTDEARSSAGDVTGQAHQARDRMTEQVRPDSS